MMGGMQETQPQEPGLFPRITRFITEYATFAIIIASSCVVLVGIAIEGSRLYDNYQQKEALIYKKVQIAKELQYWQSLTRQFPDYRDVYYKIASLQYGLGDDIGAKKSLDMALSLDPNFENAHVLGTAIEAK